MNIIYYYSGKDDSSRKVKRIIEIVVATEKYQVFHKLPDFENYLRASVSHQDIIILQADNVEILQKLTALQDFFSNQRIILILPDNKKETIALGHALRPRFITYPDSDLREMATVLSNMLRTANTGVGSHQKPATSINQ